jgi:hypothetical protein
VSDWVCGRCKSINRERAAACYSCGGMRGAVQLQMSSSTAIPASPVAPSSAPATAAPIAAAAGAEGGMLAGTTLASGIPVAEVASPPVPAEPAGMGDIAGGVIGGAIGAFLATAVWYGVVVATGWQIGLVAIAVGFIVGYGVVLGAGRHPSIALVPISVVFTLVALVASEYLIATHFLGVAAAEISAETGIPIAEIKSFFTPVELLRFSIESEPITLLFWAIAGYEAFAIPMRAVTRSNG